MARTIMLVLAVALGLVFVSRSCGFSRPGGPVALTHGRIVAATGYEETTRFIVLGPDRVVTVARYSGHDDLPAGARQIDVTGLYVAAATFDRSSPKLIDGIRHVWVGQMSVGDPGDVVILRINPARVRPGEIPDVNAIVGAVVNGAYYTAGDLKRSR